MTTRRRELVAALVSCLAGACGLLAAAAQPWARARVATPGLPSHVVSVLGHQLSGWPTAGGLAGLAGTAGLIAAGRRLRAVVGALVAAAGLAAVTVGVSGPSSAGVRAAVAAHPGSASGAAFGYTTTGWHWVAATGGLLLALAGASASWRARHWPTLGRRYDAPTAHAAPRQDMWAALDRGEDPTLAGSEPTVRADVESPPGANRPPR